MNQTIKELFERKSVRAYLDTDITEEQKQTILQAAVMAPTAGNQQFYTIIDVTDKELQEKLAVSCDNQPFIAKGKMILVFCIDCQKWYDAFLAAGAEPSKPGYGDFLLAAEDTMAAAQNAVVAAESLGIGSCYIGDILENYEYHKELLHLPKYVFPLALLVFGYPTEQQKNRKKPERVSMKHIVHENHYRHMDENELREMFSEKTASTGFDEWMKQFCSRKYNSDFAEEMDRSVKEMLRELDR